MHPIVVTAGVIRDDRNRILISKRPDSKDNQPGKWECPGGKLEYGEKPEHGLEREINEELGIIISVGELMTVVSHVYEKVHVVLLVYMCTLDSGEAKSKEYQKIKWVYPDELDDYDFCEADIKILDLLKQLQKG